jgi:phage gpG-like protein
MSDPLRTKIELTPEAEKVLSGLQTLPPRLAREIANAMNLENQFTLANIVQNHLTGKGPYPVEQHKLGERSHLLRNSARTSDAVIAGDKVESAIGSNVKYAGVHEFGARIHIPSHPVTVRLRTDARGNLVRQLGHSNLAMFARAGHKRVRAVKTQTKAYDVNIPARAPFMTGIRERSKNYALAVSRAIANAWNQNS